MSTQHNDGGAANSVTRWMGSIRLDSCITISLDSAKFKVTPKMWKRMCDGLYGDAFSHKTNFDSEPGFVDRASAARASIASARERIAQMERDILRLRIGIEQMEALKASDESYWSDDPEVMKFARNRRAKKADAMLRAIEQKT